MRNKPNLCVFWAVSGDCEEKQSQSKPISPHKIAKIPCSTVHLSTVLLSQAKGLPHHCVTSEKTGVKSCKVTLKRLLCLSM